uniref:Ras GEF n=2 Tax=Moniliophthora roreri TaxID=221103 RepID=A0A0W0FV06_MONRR
MYMSSNLKIDTSVSSVAGPSSGFQASAERGTFLTSPPASSLAVTRINRSRTISNASSVSSLDIISPQTSSSTNASTTSLALPSSRRSPSPNLVSPLSLDGEDSEGEERAPMAEYVLAMHDYSQPEGSTCLSFRAGQVIHVLNRDPSGWWDGELEGRRGWFPSNYVNADVDLPVVGGEDDQTISRTRTHTYTRSNASAPAPPTDYSLSRSRLPSGNSDIESYVPPLMVPLLHGLSLLQSAARANRITHFQPSTACIISCVRSILTATDTLNREAPILARYPSLAIERKLILSTLASLVSQTKRASEDEVDEDMLELEVDAMLRLAQQVFTLIRRFLAVAVQCGIELPERRESVSIMSEMHEGDETVVEGESSVRPSELEPKPSVVDTGRTPTKAAFRRRPGTPGGRAKSLGDLRNRAKHQKLSGGSPIPPLPNRPQANQERDRVHTHKQEMSVSSTASSSSLSSLGTTTIMPVRPPFPSGPCTVGQVIEALRYTHDHYLSTIAAFIGHAHTHSRSSHASSTGHMYDLVREIVEMSCKLLAIIEAVLQHPDVPNHKFEPLKAAKESLYNVTTDLAEAVRLLTLPLSPSITEEAEKQSLLRTATHALRAGGELSGTVKLCLNRSLGDRPFILHIPSLGDPDGTQKYQLTKAASSSALGNHYSTADEEDLTIQPQNGVRNLEINEASSGSESSSFSKSSSSRSADTNVTSPEDVKPPPLVISQAPVESDLASPTSFMRTDEDGQTTWEGSTRNLGMTTPGLEEKIFNGDLPAIPPQPPMPDLVADPAGFLYRPDYSPEDIAYNTDGLIVGATLDVLVEHLTPHGSIVDSAFSAVFFMTFRLFCSPVEFANALITRYNLVPPPGLSPEQDHLWRHRKGLPVRLRVSNTIKQWLETYWRPHPDNTALPLLENFTREALHVVFPGPAERILDLIRMYSESSQTIFSPNKDRARDPGMSLNPPSAVILNAEIPRPTMTKTLLAALRARNFASIAITDFDALELARQLTIMECNLYCAVSPEEILESGQECAKSPVNVKAVSSLSTAITGWVAESILDEHDTKKRTALVKFCIKVADKCTSLHNFSTFRSILAALDSSTIARLRDTWTGLPQKSRGQLEVMRRLADHSRNYREYRTRLRNTAPPAVPFLGIYLTDVTFCREGNPSHRNSPDKKLLNFNKYHKLARIVQDMQRFQVPYNLKAIPEVQEYLNFVFQDSRKNGDFHELYRRSLLLEPRQPADPTPTPSVERPMFLWTRSLSQASVLTSSS